MKLTVYKGFSVSFLTTVDYPQLVDCPIENKKNVLSFDKKTRKQLDIALLGLEDNDEVWVTYEEYTLIKTRVDKAMEEDGLNLVIFRNNLFPDYYPINFEISEELAQEISKSINGDSSSDSSEGCQRFLAIYNTLVNVDGVYYGSFYNYEYDRDSNILTTDFYPSRIKIEEGQEVGEYNIFLNEDIDTYLRDLTKLKDLRPSIIGLKSTDGYASKRFQSSLQAYCISQGIRIVRFHEVLPEDREMENELFSIAKNDIGIENFCGFRKIKYYKNPDISKEVVELSQGQIIQEIIQQAENSYDDSKRNSFRDIFITASTGAGKSVMFQIPAVYLAKKYKKLTIIIEPVKALMQDQKEKLNRSGYKNVEAFNSDLISQVEKEAVLEKIRNGAVDLLYLSPETLLSYSIETIIGDREIGLLIVDEAHIVTTWGVGFRPDYWYLGGYINRLRNQIQTTKGTKRRTYHFPICAFTATAINGGIDDSVSDTIISLYMENPIKYIGYVRRDDIKFDIVHKGTITKLPKADYEAEKTKALNDRIVGWLNNNEKTIVYFPFASLARDASKGLRGFAGIITDKRIGTYTGRNINDTSIELFNDAKRQTFEGFRIGTIPIMLATKAFGMGVDIDDVKNVYHYAITGNLSDYVQEIGRAARKSSMEGVAISDNYYNDLTFMKVLFGMSQIRQYQIKAVLEGIYDTYKSKRDARSFLISPESFTYIFNGKGAKDEGSCINKLKTCLLMLEKDFYDKYNFKVIISRPQSVFTKAFVCVRREDEKKVLTSEYGNCFKFIEKGRCQEKQSDGTLLSDTGDIYSIDLKKIWEEYHPKISFPQFKYWYFNADSKSKDKIDIMSSIRSYFSPRQKVNIEARRDLLLCDLRSSILDDFEYIANKLYAEYGKQFFTTEDFAKLLREKYGIANARIIANSLFELVDPSSACVKRRTNDITGKSYYSLAHGNFKELMRRTIIKSRIVSNISQISDSSSYSSYLNLSKDDNSTIALKLLSIFDYITYEIVGGEEPEIFIRLNDPNKIRSIVLGQTYYTNNYVTKAKQKHDRDVEILLQFFNGLQTDVECWDYIEEYFLGYDVLSGVKPTNLNPIKMTRAIDKEHSYPTNLFKSWDDMASFFDDNDHLIINKLISFGIVIPEFLETEIKKSEVGNDIVMSWPSKEVLICQQDTSDIVMEFFRLRGWHAYRIYDIDFEKIKEELS
jgi:ATP-dependent DNA helicase RecQ